LPELWADIMDIGFDGVIAAAGGYVECDGQVLFHVNVPLDDVRAVVEGFDARDIQYFPTRSRTATDTTTWSDSSRA
jgi:hypothetical protein